MTLKNTSFVLPTGIQTTQLPVSNPTLDLLSKNLQHFVFPDCSSNQCEGALACLHLQTEHQFFHLQKIITIEKWSMLSLSNFSYLFPHRSEFLNYFNEVTFTLTGPHPKLDHVIFPLVFNFLDSTGVKNTVPIFR